MSPLLAAGSGVPEFLPPMVAIVGGAALVGYLSTRVRVVPLVGFLVAGVAVGPEQLGIISDPELVDAAAEVGVILLLFTIGLEFSLERLARMSRLIFVAGTLQVALTAAVVTGLAAAGGVPVASGVFTGLVVSLSSTAIVLKLLDARGEWSTPRGRTGLAVLLFQDLAVVAMVLAVPVLAGDGADPGGIATALGTAAGLVAGVLVLARRAMPPLLDLVARACSPEVFLLTLVAICFGTAWLSAALGVSVALGAFLAGLVVSESRHSTHAFGEILPLQTLFSAVFFVSIGMLLDVGFLVREPALVLGAIAGILGVKALTTVVAVRAGGMGWPTAAGAALLLAQVGEFSFVLESLGREEGLSPLDLGADGSQALIGATVVLMVATPALGAAGTTLERWLGDRRSAGRGAAPPPAPADERERSDHVVVAGYGTAARSMVGELRHLGTGFTVVTLNPDGAAAAAADGIDVVVGDYGKRHVLVEVGIRRARLLLVADDGVERTEHVAALTRLLNPAVTIVARPLGEPDVAELAAAGADHLVVSDRSSTIALAMALRDTLGPGGGDGLPLSAVVSFTPDRTSPCRHLSTIIPVQPSAHGCEDCLRIGSRWVHLRICLGCGHVGCCDSSPHGHARAHSAGTGHPLVTSAEPGEDWAYCFLDDTTISPEPATPAPGG